MDLDLPLIGRRRERAEVTSVVALTEDDLALLAEPRPAPASPLQRITDRHHGLARILADGMEHWEAAIVTGYNPSYISFLLTNPTFKDLVAFYRTKTEAKYADMGDRLHGLGMVSTETLLERLENDPDSISNGMLLDIVKVAADRTGHGPATTNVQVNVGLAGRLEAARRRVIEGTATEVSTPSGGLVRSSEDGG